MKVIFFLIFNILYCSNLLAIEYRWLEKYLYSGYLEYESPSVEQVNWLKDQEKTKQEYFSRMFHSPMEEEISDYYSSIKTLKTLHLKDKTIRLVLAENASSHQVIMTSDKDRKVLFDSSKFNDFDSEFYLPRTNSIADIQLSPTKQYLVVFAPSFFGTIYYNIYVYDLVKHKYIKTKITYAYPKDFHWSSPHIINYYNYALKMFNGFDLEKNQHLSMDERIPPYENLKKNEKSTYSFSFNPTKRDHESALIIKHFDKERPEYHTLKAFTMLKSINDLENKISSPNILLFASRKPYSSEVLLVSYEKENDEIKIIDSRAIPAPSERGSFQDFFSMGEDVVLEYMSGSEKTYYIYNKELGLTHKLKAPDAKLKNIKKISKDKFEFTFISEVKDQTVIEITSEELSSWNPSRIDKIMYRDEKLISYKHFFIKAISKDKTIIPIRVIHREDLSPSEQTPLFTQAYGGHGITSYFHARYEVGLHSFLSHKGIYATPAVRGGSEYGPTWHTQVYGSLVRYEDTISAMVKLHTLKMGSPSTTAFEGWSNGGLLAGVMLTMRPDLFKLVIPGNGIQDMERRQVLDSPFAWNEEFGSARTKESINYIQTYSPLYNSQEKKNYPTVYVMTGGRDKRVNPSHSLKLVASLQDHQLAKNPIILDYYRNESHWLANPQFSNSNGLKSLISKWKVIFHELKMDHIGLN